MKCDLRKMSVSDYKKWLKDSRTKDASLPGFFNGGSKRTLNVLQGDATKASVSKWKSFKARHGAMFCKKPTYKRAIALRNWGINAKIPKEGKK